MQKRIDERLAEIGVPAPRRLQKRHGSVVIGDILREGAPGTVELDCQERLVLFYNLSDSGVKSLPIFALVTETSITWTLSQLLQHLIEEKRALEGSTQVLERNHLPTLAKAQGV